MSNPKPTRPTPGKWLVSRTIIWGAPRCSTLVLDASCATIEIDNPADARLIERAPDLYGLAQDILAGATEWTPKPILEKAARLVREIDGDVATDGKSPLDTTTGG